MAISLHPLICLETFALKTLQIWFFVVFQNCPKYPSYRKPFSNYLLTVVSIPTIPEHEVVLGLFVCMSISLCVASVIVKCSYVQTGECKNILFIWKNIHP